MDCFTLYMILMIALLWFLVANQWTYHDQVKLIDAVYWHPPGDKRGVDWELVRVALNVDYDQHLLRRILFTDPWRLYPGEVRERLRQHRDWQRQPYPSKRREKHGQA